MKTYLFFTIAVATIATISASVRVKRAPLKISVYYESHCPDSREFIMSQLYPVFCKAEKYVTLNLVPFGKAYSLGSRFSCQHGPKECRGNTIHNCVLKRLREPKSQVDYVNCAMYDPDQPGHIEKTCVEASSVNVEEVQNCFNSEEGRQLMLKAENETKTMTPGPLFVPTIVFDDVYDHDDQKYAFTSFESTLCEKLVNRGHKEVCSNGAFVDTQTC